MPKDRHTDNDRCGPCEDLDVTQDEIGDIQWRLRARIVLTRPDSTSGSPRGPSSRKPTDLVPEIVP
jgi:hypothetical protein